MRAHVRTRIFFPVLLLIIAFPVFTWIIFTSASGWYVKYTARQDLERLMGQIQAAAVSVYGEEGRKTGEAAYGNKLRETPAPAYNDQAMELADGARDQEKALSRELLTEVKAILKRGDARADMVILNSREKVVYPKTERAEESPLVRELKDMLSSGRLRPEGALREFESEGQTYVAELYEAEASGNVRARYFIGYMPAPDPGALLSYTGGLLLAITAGLFLAASAAAWMTAGSVARPLKALCGQAENIGSGRFEPIEEVFSIWEAEQLKESFNNMAHRLAVMEETQNQFFQNVSHDLRTPLMSICGYAQGIQCGVFEDQKGAADVILSESLRLKEMVDSILTISRLDNGNMELHMEPIPLRGFAEAQAEALKGLFLDKKVCLEVEEQGPVENPVTALADAELLGRILGNILSNAAAYASVHVRLALSQERGVVRIRVEDDGPGFSQQALPHLFERFYKGKNGNFGIGLSIVRSAAEYMGGKVEAFNREQPEHGAIFVITLRAAGDRI